MATTFLLKRACAATAIPAGHVTQLPAGTEVTITQTLGGNVTVRTDQGLFQIAREDGSAIDGYVPEGLAETEKEAAAGGGEFREEDVWATLKTCFDPEIPVNIVDLGLVYDLAVEEGSGGGKRVDVKMTLTAQGCGMGPAIAEDARRKIASLPTVESAKVHIVWDPVWAPQMISPAGRKALGLD